MSGFEIFFYVMLGGFVGWAGAHYTIAIECKKLGRFYVDKEVFHCTKIEVKPKSNTNNKSDDSK